jgi:preprotein translocase subunit SecY
MQLLTTMVPSLEAMKKEGEVGRKKINQYTRYGTVILATFQGFGISVGLQSFAFDGGGEFFLFAATTTLVGGTVVLMWLGEQITARGVGNGISLIIFVGIVAELPSALAQFFATQRQDGSALLVIGVLVMAIAVIAFVVFIERALRKIPIQYPQRQVGMKVYQGDRSMLPLKVNTAGVIPPIFASSLLLLPTTVAGFQAAGGGVFADVAAYLGRGSPLFLIIFVSLIVFFCFFYTSIVFNPDDVADNLKKHNGFIPGIRPGKKTAEYLDYVLTRLTVVGSMYLAFVCLLPELLISNLSVPFYFGGTSLLIVVSVTMDTISQVQSHLLAHQYEGLIQKSKLRGGKGSRSRGGRA